MIWPTSTAYWPALEIRRRSFFLGKHMSLFDNFLQSSGTLAQQATAGDFGGLFGTVLRTVTQPNPAGAVPQPTTAGAAIPRPDPATSGAYPVITSSQAGAAGSTLTSKRTLWIVGGIAAVVVLVLVMKK